MDREEIRKWARRKEEFVCMEHNEIIIGSLKKCPSCYNRSLEAENDRLRDALIKAEMLIFNAFREKAGDYPGYQTIEEAIDYKERE